jgi:hypothetical protein
LATIFPLQEGETLSGHYIAYNCTATDDNDFAVVSTFDLFQREELLPSMVRVSEQITFTSLQAISIAGQWLWLRGRDRRLGLISPYGCSVVYHLNHCI